MSIKTELLLILQYFKINLKTAIEYRANFIIQAGAIVLNNCMWIVFWWIFMNKFESLNGWDLNGIFQLYAVLMVSWGLASMFFGKKGYIAQSIAEGKLDFHLSLPKNVMLHLLHGKASWLGAGDFFFGLMIAILIYPFSAVPLYSVLVLCGVVIFASIAIIAGSLAFFFKNAHETSRTMLHSMVIFGFYPLDIFHGASKIILLTLLPAGFVASVPAMLLQEFNWPWFLALIGATFTFAAIATIVFYIGLKRYESGNMMNVRV